ncbi:MAG: EI24 domain-containing protein [Myxococcota bacterium]
MSTDLPDLASLSASGKALRGARYALAGVKIVATRPRLWVYLVAPVVITLGMFLGMSVTAWGVISWGLSFVWTPGPNASAWLAGAWWFLALAAKLMAVGTIGLGVYFAAGLIATPFNDRLSEHVETSALGPYEEAFSWRVLMGDLALSLSHSLLSLALWITVMVASLAMNLIPVVGSVASFAIGTTATAMFLARESMDGCMSRRRLSYGHKYRILMAQLPMMLGFGVVASLMLWIPFLNFLLLPMAVAGGTLMYCHLEQQGLIPDVNGAPGYTPNRSRVAALADHQVESDGLDERIADREPLHAHLHPSSVPRDAG